MSPLRPDELALLDEIAAANIAAASMLQQFYKPRLIWFARMMGVPAQDCADLVQDVFLIVIRKVREGQFRRDSRLITWMDGILKNRIKDLWRSRRYYRDHFVSFDSDQPDDELFQHVMWTSNSLDDYIDVRRVLNRLPRELRVILLLSEAEGLTVNEISRRIRKPAGIVGRKLAEAKKTFRGLEEGLCHRAQ
jgi:RNA polymerase sigma factor (sigma-70 family)